MTSVIGLGESPAAPLSSPCAQADCASGRTDIGQYGSKIGAARNRGIDVLVNEVSNRATPTLVAFGPRTRMIGETAKTQETSNFRNTIGSLKRLIGRTIE
jgi:heat shock protein 4